MTSLNTHSGIHSSEHLSSLALSVVKPLGRIGRERISLKRSENIQHYTLPGSLPQGDTLALNTTLGVLSYLTLQDGLPHEIGQQQFTTNELRVLVPLLENHPYFCPHELLYASFYHERTDEHTVAMARQQLEEAIDTEIWNEQMRPVRNIISRTRIKLHLLGIDIKTILLSGYVLQVLGG